jgi:hypothetical protein
VGVLASTPHAAPYQPAAIRWQEIVIALGGLVVFASTFFSWAQIHLDYGALYQASFTLTGWGLWSGALAGVAGAGIVLYSLVNHFAPLRWLPKAGITVIVLGVVALGGAIVYPVQAAHLANFSVQGLTMGLAPGIFTAYAGIIVSIGGGILSLN